MTEKGKTNNQRKKQRRLVTILFAVGVGMFGFGYALVPFYNVLCNVLGINGKTSNTAVSEVAADVIDKTRTVTVEFLATNNKQLPWKFYPETKKIKIHPGERVKVSYFAQNDTGQDMTVQAIPSVAPGLAAKHLKKTECFCFTQQTLAAHEAAHMPLLFHLDPDLPKKISTVTLSYTLFDVGHLKVKNNKTPGKIG